MTGLLQQAFEKISRLPDLQQDQLAKFLLAFEEPETNLLPTTEFPLDEFFLSKEESQSFLESLP